MIHLDGSQSRKEGPARKSYGKACWCIRIKLLKYLWTIHSYMLEMRLNIYHETGAGQTYKVMISFPTSPEGHYLVANVNLDILLRINIITQFPRAVTSSVYRCKPSQCASLVIMIQDVVNYRQVRHERTNSREKCNATLFHDVRDIQP